jgi:glucose-1-phosphate adenylyltransferase
MDFAQMIDAHVASGLPCTVAGIRQPIGLANQFGVIEKDPDSDRIAAFREKPSDPVGLADSPDEVLASMGNYVFDTAALIEAVTRDAGDDASNHDMGGNIIPGFVAAGQAGVYDFVRNEVPGSTDRDRDYWRDVGTIDSYFEAQQDLIMPLPIFNLYNSEWPIHSQQINHPPAKFISDAAGNAGVVTDSIVSLGVIISGATVRRTVLGPSVTIRSGAQVDDAVIFERTTIGAGAVVRRAILDKDVSGEPGAQVGVDHDADRARGFTVTDSGITVVGKGVVVR